jgi:glucan 1,3-beta-glucosidase
MADLDISGGKYGLNIGNQQFTMRNVKISKAVIGISQIWNWGWLYSGLSISECGTAFSMINGYDVEKLQVGSVVIIDSEITNCPVFVDVVSYFWILMALLDCRLSSDHSDRSIRLTCRSTC